MTRSMFRPASLRPAVAVSAAMLAPAIARAQLTPDRTYYGVGRPVPMHVARPAGAEGELSIQLHTAGGRAGRAEAEGAKLAAAEPLATAAVIEGPVDVAALLPMVWKQPSPALVYAQLFAGPTPVGAPVVVQPLLTPKYAVGINPQNHQPYWKESKPDFSGIRAYADKHVVLDTSLGEIEFALRPDQAPNTAWNFITLVQGGFYTDLLFHRVVGAKEGRPPFVIQTGDPTGLGDGGPGYYLDLEDSKLPHDFGVLSMARDDDPNTNGSQIFVGLSRKATEKLDGRYTSFGQAVRGADVINAIGQSPVLPEESKEGLPKDRPVKPAVLRSARLIDAPPYGQGPAPVRGPAEKSGAER